MVRHTDAEQLKAEGDTPFPALEGGTLRDGSVLELVLVEPLTSQCYQIQAQGLAIQEEWRVWSELVLMWGGYLCCLFAEVNVGTHINYFYHMSFGIISIPVLNFVFLTHMIIAKHIIHLTLA